MRLAAVLCFVLLPLAAGAAGVDNALYARLLAAHNHDGLVDYQGLLQDRAGLSRYLDQLAAVDPHALDSDEAKAFYVNLYNAATLELILRHYPVESIKDIGTWFTSPWEIEFVRLDGERVSLDHIEHDILRPRFGDPRIHFAVNCASMSCPPLFGEPFEGERIDRQLDLATRRFINDSGQNRLQGNTLLVSRLFDWYQEDWGGEEEVAGFVVRYAEGQFRRELQARRDNLELEYADYDWSLNEVP